MSKMKQCSLVTSNYELMRVNSKRTMQNSILVGSAF